MQRKVEVARPPSLGRSAPELAVREDNVRLFLIVATWPAFPENTDSLPGEKSAEGQRNRLAKHNVVEIATGRNERTYRSVGHGWLRRLCDVEGESKYEIGSK